MTKQVAQIRTRNEELPFHVISLSVGADIFLPITYRDALGIYDSGYSSFH